MREWEQAEEEISVWEWGTVQDRLKVRIGVLEALAKTRQVSPEVCEILVRAVSPDLDGKLEEDRIGAPGRGSKAADAVAKLQERLHSCVNELEDRTQMGDDPVRRTGQWTRIAMAWRLAGPPAPHGSVRRELVELWSARLQAPGQLAEQGLLTEDEASVIKTDSDYQVMAHHLLVDDDAWGLLRVLQQSPAGVSLHRLERAPAGLDSRGA